MYVIKIKVPTYFVSFLSKAGIVRLQWDLSSQALLYTGCLDGVVRLWDSRSGTCEREWYGHEAEVLDLSLAK